MAKKVINSVFSYNSLCCQERADKTPCKAEKADSKGGHPTPAALGKWKCTRCRKTCKVNRTKRVVEQVQEAA